MPNGKNHWKSRTLELEEILEKALAALSLIPIQAIEKGYSWMPSDEALRTLERAKLSVSSYAEAHWSRK